MRGIEAGFAEAERSPYGAVSKEWQPEVMRLRQGLLRLMRAHRLKVLGPDVEVIAAEFRRFRAESHPRRALSGPMRRRRQSLQRQLQKFVRYFGTPPSRKESIDKLRLRILMSLQHSTLRAELHEACNVVNVSLPAVLNDLQRKKIRRRDLRRILAAMSSSLKTPAKRTGRRRAPETRIATLGFVIWTEAGKPKGFTWLDPQAELGGPLPSFMREFLSLFPVSIDDQKLKSMLVKFQKDPSLATAPRTR